MIYKTTIRERGKRARAALDAETRAEFDARIITRCRNELSWNDYERVMLFLPNEHQNEINTWPLVRWIWAEHPAVEMYVPRINGATMEAARLTPLTRLAQNEFGISEPTESEALHTGDRLDLILTPLLGFDSAGNRVGYGRGYFDRFFARQSTAERVGLGYECLFSRDKIDVERHDVMLSRNITEERVINF